MRQILGNTFFTIFVCLSATIGARGQSFPDGRGKAEFLRMCGTCHKLDLVVGKRLGEDGWAGIVDDMVGRGAQGTQDELDRVIRYLASSFGTDKPVDHPAEVRAVKVNVNSANASTLVSSLGLSAADADAIVEYRQRNGDFQSWADIEKVGGINLKSLGSKKDRIEFSEAKQ